MLPTDFVNLLKLMERKQEMMPLSKISLEQKPA